MEYLIYRVTELESALNKITISHSAEAKQIAGEALREEE